VYRIETCNVVRTLDVRAECGPRTGRVRYATSEPHGWSASMLAPRAVFVVTDGRAIQLSQSLHLTIKPLLLRNSKVHHSIH
jgi:hypothetical protein